MEQSSIFVIILELLDKEDIILSTFTCELKTQFSKFRIYLWQAVFDCNNHGQFYSFRLPGGGGYKCSISDF